MRRAVLPILAIAAAVPALADDGLPLPAPELSAPVTPVPPTAESLAADVFGAATSPSILPAAAIGSYARGCLTGARALPSDGPTFQVMRPSRNRAWGHPALVEFVLDLAAAAPAAGLRGILVGDLSQPLGGPMPYGHTSHQIGLDADIWFTEMPDRRLTPEERDTLPFTSTLTPDGTLDPSAFTPAFAALVEAAARDERVARIFVHPVLKRALCERAGADRSWLRVVRPWYGHFEHFHVRLKCPPGSAACTPQSPPPAGDGCGAQLDYWFTPEPYAPKPDAEPPAPLTMARIPPLCRKIVGLR